MKITVNNICAVVNNPEQLTSGMVGKTIDVEYSAEWEGLTRIAFFTNGVTTKAIFDPADTMTIPWEVLTSPGKRVSVGFYGYNIVDGEKVLAIPTIWAELGAVRAGASPSCLPPAPPTPEIWEQIIDMIGNLADLDTDAKNNLVAAINEAYNHGGGTGDEKFIVKLNLYDEPITAEKTFTEIKSAIEAGKTVEVWAKTEEMESALDKALGIFPLSLLTYYADDDYGSMVFELTAEDGVITLTLSHDSNGDVWDYRITSIPTELADLADDATHRTVTDTEKEAWNAKTEKFIVNLNFHEPITADKTLAEITSAYNSRKVVELHSRIGGHPCVARLSRLSDNSLAEFQWDYDEIHYMFFVENFGHSDVWMVRTRYLPSYDEVSFWDEKQAAISDLAQIRAGAALGATALQSVPNTYRTSAAQDIIDNGKEATANRLGAVNPSADSIATSKYYSASAVSAFLDKLIPHYVSAHSWSVGDYCTFSGTIYKCNTAHSNVQWTSAYWDAVPDFSKDIVDNYALKDDLDELQKTALTATVTIAVADWEGGTTVTKNVTGVTASNIVFCDSSDADVQCTAQGAGTLTFTASATPSAEVTVKVVILP